MLLQVPTVLLLVAALYRPLDAYQLKVLKSPHPMLFFSVSDVADLQSKAKSTHVVISQRIMDAVATMKRESDTYLPPKDHAGFTSFWNEEFGNNLCTLAMYCVLYPHDHKALTLAHVFMERMAAQQSWEYASMPNDDLPISHSLIGVSVAYDFLYPTFSVTQRKRYFERIRNTAARQFERSIEAPWGAFHMHNRVWTNNVAILISSIVLSVHDSQAEVWIGYVVKHLNVSMNMLNLIVDGSNNEGISLSTSTTHALTMFLYLVDRHYGIKYDSYWMEQHFWYILRTLIGYKETVGIADTTAGWYHGPENMLLFIDKYVLKNGYGNWLAARVRENQPKSETSILAPLVSKRWSTYFTEFIWYDPELGERNPDPSGEPALTLFSDWGVVTYGGGLPPNNTFFSFKSGYLHGRAINAVANGQVAFMEDIDGWTSFNPEHEHPDQNSFVFYPRGQPFITGAYYGPKFSFLNNVLMFAPSPNVTCFPPFEGQLGECHMWFKWPDSAETWADIVAAHEDRGYVFTSGEAVGWYGEYLELESVYRSMLLLTPDVLLVVDHIQLKPGSKLEKTNAFFNMRQGELSLVNNSAAVLKHSNQEFHATWITADGVNTTASKVGYAYPSDFSVRETQILNISVDLRKTTRVAYLFYHGLSPHITSLKFIQSTDIGYKVAVTVSNITYELSVATHHSNVLDRLVWLKHTGYASLFNDTHTLAQFGYQPKPWSTVTVHSCLPNLFVSSLQWAGANLLADTLRKSTDFVVRSLPTLRKLFHFSTPFDPCEWPKEQGRAILPAPLYDLYIKPYTSLRELPSILQNNIKTELEAHSNARLAVFLNDGQMDNKIGLLPKLKSTKVIHVLRDPRSWVAHVIQRGEKAFDAIRDQVARGMRHTCPRNNISKPYQKLESLLQRKNVDTIEFLAVFWSAHATSVLQSGLSEEHLLLVWLEDLISEPEKTAERVFQFLGMPLPPASRHRLLQHTRSKVFELDSGEILNHHNMSWWESVLGTRGKVTVDKTVLYFVNMSALNEQ